VLVALLLLSATAAQARTSDLQVTTNVINERACIALKYSALPDRYYNCVREALAFKKAAENNGAVRLATNTTSVDSINDTSLAVSIETASSQSATDVELSGETLLLAQNTTTEVINNGISQTPRVISRPQPVAENSENSESVTDQNTETRSNPRTDVLPSWLPEPAKAWLGSVLNDEQLELLGRNWLYGLLAIAALFMLSPIFSLLGRARRRRRYAQVNMYDAQTSNNQTENLFSDLDFGDLDIPAKDDDEGDADEGEIADQVEKENQPSPAVAQASPEQTDRTIAQTPVADASEHKKSSVMTEPDAATAATEQTRTGQEFEKQEQVNAVSTEATHATQTNLESHKLPLSDSSSEAEKVSVEDIADQTVELPQALAVESLEASAPASTTTSEIQNDIAAPASIGSGMAKVSGIHTNTDSNSGSDSNSVATTSAITASDSSHQFSGRSPLTRFGTWLCELPAESGKPASMEAFMYWVSYSDGNIKPGLAEELAEAETLDDHGRIKKAVLSFRPEVLDDILLSLDQHLDHDSKKAFLDLMLAVLVKNSQPTPVQNLLIRFYADYTGIGLTELTERFVASYGHELPGIPRPDRVQWWNAQKDELADSSSALDLNLRTFGLDRTATNDDIEEAYRLAEKRHNQSLRSTWTRKNSY